MIAPSQPEPAVTEEPQLTFDFLLPWSERKALVTVPEAAEVISIGQDAVRNLLDNAELEAHRFTAFGDSNSRLTNRITRRSLLLWLVKTANYAPSAIVQTMLQIARTLTPNLRATLIAGLQTQQREK